MLFPRGESRFCGKINWKTICETIPGQFPVKQFFFAKLAEVGADWITVSFDGTKEEYNRIRKPLIFEDTLQKLKDIKLYKDKHGLAKPVIKVQGIWPAIKKDPEGYYNALSPVSDLVAFNPLIDYLHNDSGIVF